MKPLRCLFGLIPILFLVSCGVSPIYKNSCNDIYTISAQYGSVNGSWGRASREANEAAASHCTKAGSQVILLTEQRTGLPGFTPQESTITFKCDPPLSTLSNTTLVNISNPQVETVEQKNQLETCCKSLLYSCARFFLVMLHL